MKLGEGRRVESGTPLKNRRTSPGAVARQSYEPSFACVLQLKTVVLLLAVSPPLDCLRAAFLSPDGQVGSVLPVETRRIFLLPVTVYVPPFLSFVPLNRRSLY